MKTMLKLTLMIALLGTTVMADGEMGSGGRQCPPEGCPPPPCTANCGGAMVSSDTDVAVDSTDTVLTVVETVEDALLFVL